MQPSGRLIVTLSLALGLAAGAPAQEDEPAPDPALAEKIKRFKDAVEERDRSRDGEARGLIDEMLAASKGGLHPKDRVAVLKALGQDCLLSPRVKRPREESLLFEAAAHALGNAFGADGAKVLMRAYESPKFEPERDWIELRAVFLRCIGETADEKAVKFLLDRASRDPSDDIMRAAGAALGNYQQADQQVRKEIAKELIKKFNEIYGKSRGSLDPGDPIVKKAKDTLAAISNDWNTTLQKLTGQRDINEPDAWQHFYNKNKAKDWSKL